MSLPTNGAIMPENRLDSIVWPAVNALHVLTYRDQQVLTAQALAEGYAMAAIRIQQNHTRNGSRFIEGKHYLWLTGVELKTFRPTIIQRVG